MECFIARYSDKGGRDNNEDYVGITDDTYVVCDGLGGHSDGETASRMAVEYLLKAAVEIQKINDDEMHNMIYKVNSLICKNRIGNMATTVVAGFVRGDVFNYFNVGDSRLYYFRNNRIIVQSKDHSVTQACVDMGEIKADKMRFHPDRNKLTKALGLKEEIKVNQKFQPFKVEIGDSFLLCTDGFWEYVYEKEMQKYLKKASTPQEWLDAMLKKALTRTQRNHDNISAVCVMIK